LAGHKAKPGFALIIPFLIILGVPGFIMPYNKARARLAFMVIIASVVTRMFLTTNYQLDDRVLRIKSSILFRKTIGGIPTSPKDKSRFIYELKKINPGIDFDLDTMKTYKKPGRFFS
jgi:hypothetical protein